MNLDYVKEIIEKKEIFIISDIYSPDPIGNADETNCDYFTRCFTSAQKGEMIVPILGLQGTGKSTLLNALLMDDLVLPVNGQETNCIPAEIRGGMPGKLKMLVHFLDKNTPSKEVYSPSELEQFVSDEFNHANCKKVSHAEIFVSHPLLENNLVFVDLPGVGSLTEQNVNVTMDYLKRQAGAIFLLNTYRPITRSEKLFLKTALKGMGVFWFVQNRWADERDDEVEESVNHNKMILKTLISDPNYEPTIFVINAKHAFENKFSNDKDLLSQTGITTFIENLFVFQKNWRKALIISFYEAFRLFIIQVQTNISNRIDDHKKSKIELEEELTKKKHDYKAMMDRNTTKINQIRDDVNCFNLRMKDVCKEESKIFSDDLRARMREEINQGIIDGERLNKAFQDNQSYFNEKAIIKISDEILDFNEKCMVKIEELEIETAEFGKISLGSFKKKEELKFEKAFSPIGGILGGVGGFFAGEAVAAALEGGALGAAAGPIGIAVGVAVGLIGAAIGWFFYKKTRNSRMNVTISDLEKPLKDARKSLEDHLIKTVDNHCNNLNDTLKKFKDNEEANFTKLFNEAEQRIKSRMESNQDDIDLFKKHLDFISTVAGNL